MTDYTHPISELQKTDRIYHGTPEWKLFRLLNEGISVKEANKYQDNKKVQFITPSLEEAIYFTHHVHLMFDDRNKYLGVFEINPKKLSKRIRDSFKQDKMNPTSLVTFRSIPVDAYEKLILIDVNGNRNDMVKTAHKIKRDYAIDVIAIDYDLKLRRFNYKQ